MNMNSPAPPIGALVTWSEKLGVVVEQSPGRLRIRFDDGEMLTFSQDAGSVRRIEFDAGHQVSRLGSSDVGVVLQSMPGASPSWQVAFPGGLVATVDEAGLRPAVISDPVRRFKANKIGRANAFNLRSVAADLWAAHRSNALVSLAHARVDLKPHQVSVVHRVVSTYPHRFLLCDEVGLGKTIEAGLIVKELRARGQARRVLVLVPAGLTRQWQYEFKTKFNESFAIYDGRTIPYLKGKGVANPWTDTDSIITSHDWAAYTDQRITEISSVGWDMVIVDEAHHVRVHRSGRSETRTRLFRLVNELIGRPEFARRAALLITATPMQLERYELYALTELLDPVLFASEQDFERHLDALRGLNSTVESLQRWYALDDEQRAVVAADVARLFGTSTEDVWRSITREGPSTSADALRQQHRLSEVLIRNRKTVVQGFQKRSAFSWEVTLNPAERAVHDRMEAILRRGFVEAEVTKQNAIGFVMVILQRLLASSSRALLASLKKRRAGLSRNLRVEDGYERLAEDSEASEVVSRMDVEFEIEEIDDVIRELERVGRDSKAHALLGGLREIFHEDPDAKVLIFTEFRETQEMLQELLSAEFGVSIFHGQLTAEQKDAAVDAFRDGTGAQVLVSTEAGGEGRNFQFCHFLVNYDLPWNPMRLEQRIGRVDRIGQTHPIAIFNFHVRDTIEGRILDVLERRIKVFTEAIGGLDPILGETESDIRRALRLSKEARNEALDQIGAELERRIAEAREAEVKYNDFILQDKSYSAEIARTVLQVESPVSPPEFERFLVRLLQSSGAFVSEPSRSGERRVVFGPPFAVERKDLLDGQEARRVSFDPSARTDAELVEYFGFGHPIVDALVQRVVSERHDGASAVRRAGRKQGWQFNWRLEVGGLRPKTLLVPVFVPDATAADAAEGERLLRLSRDFNPEDAPFDRGALDGLDAAYTEALAFISNRRDGELAEAQRLADERASVEEERVRRLADHKRRAAEDRISSCEATLSRVRASDDALTRQATPLWEANVARARAELEAIDRDLGNALEAIAKNRQPAAELVLVSAARIESAS